MSYRVDILRIAQKQLARVDRQFQLRIIEAIRALAHDPRPHGSMKLSGRAAMRIRVGAYRVIYEVHDGHLLILVVALGHRRDVYDR